MGGRPCRFWSAMTSRIRNKRALATFEAYDKLEDCWATGSLRFYRSLGGVVFYIDSGQDHIGPYVHILIPTFPRG